MYIILNNYYYCVNNGYYRVSICKRSKVLMLRRTLYHKTISGPTLLDLVFRDFIISQKCSTKTHKHQIVDEKSCIQMQQPIISLGMTHRQ